MPTDWDEKGGLRLAESYRPELTCGLQSPSGAVTSLGYHNYSVAWDTNLRLR
jgi:hypothetical protein